MYVLVTGSLSVLFDDVKEIYPSFENEDNSAIYVKDSIFEAITGEKVSDSFSLWDVVEWPESQMLEDNDEIRDQCEFIVGGSNIDDFILPAYWCPKKLLDKI